MPAPTSEQIKQSSDLKTQIDAQANLSAAIAQRDALQALTSPTREQSGQIWILQDVISRALGNGPIVFSKAKLQEINGGMYGYKTTLYFSSQVSTLPADDISNTNPRLFTDPDYKANLDSLNAQLVLETDPGKRFILEDKISRMLGLSPKYSDGFLQLIDSGQYGPEAKTYFQWQIQTQLYLVRNLVISSVLAFAGYKLLTK